MAAKKTPGWLIGCGIGCGAVLLGLAVLIGLGALWTRNTMGGFNSAVDSRQQLEETIGRPGEFTPLPDGSIPAGRMEAFLAVRERTQPTREQIAGVFEKMPLSDAEAREMEEAPFLEKMSRVWDIGSSAMGMARDLGYFLDERNRALLDVGMGLGEYTYIYSVAYYAFLDHSPGDGPGDRPGEGGESPRHGSVRVMGTRTSSRVRSHMESILANQLAALPQDAPEDLRRALANELSAMEQDPDHMPWRDGLPEPIALSLEPYRDRLEATYSPATNGLELSRVEKRSSVSFTAD